MARDARIFVVGEGIGPRGGNFNTTLGLSLGGAKYNQGALEKRSWIVYNLA